MWDLQREISIEEANILADTLAEDYLAGKVDCYPWGGRSIIGKKYANKHCAIDLFINRNTGQLVYGVSGIDNNPTRYPNYPFGLHPEIAKLYDPQKNPVVALIIELQSNRKHKYSYKPGNCAEASTESLLRAIGIKNDGWEHITRKVDLVNGVQDYPMCDYCKAALLRGEELESFLEDMNAEAAKYNDSRSEYNPRSGC